MTKQILPNELAEIVTGLLIKPELLGELDSREVSVKPLPPVAITND
ncbi:TPA: hypothetical protein L9P83_004126 [Klebsiella pneumoniae]|nr:hypothetical protein [Klebsiella pneumoniae]